MNLVGSLRALSREHYWQNVRLDGWKRDNCRKAKYIFACVLAFVKKGRFSNSSSLGAWKRENNKVDDGHREKAAEKQKLFYLLSNGTKPAATEVIIFLLPSAAESKTCWVKVGQI